MMKLDTVEMKRVSFDTGLKYPPNRTTIAMERLYDFSAIFDFGRSYIINSYPTEGAWAVSHLLAGYQRPVSKSVESSGMILLNGSRVSRHRLRQLSWTPGKDRVKQFGRHQQSAAQQIEHGIKSGVSPSQWTMQDFIDRFFLEKRYLNQLLSRVSGAQLETGCAVGLANGKRIFCFRYVKTWRPNLLDPWFNMGFRKVVNALTEQGCLVVIPMLYHERFQPLCDEIIHVGLPPI